MRHITHHVCLSVRSVSSESLVYTESRVEDSTVQWYLSGCVAADTQLVDVPIDEFPFTIGRQSGCSLTIRSRSISKRHAELLVAGDGIFLRDPGSTNGTFVNGCRVERDTPVDDGDLMRFADVEFRLCRAQSSGDYDVKRTATIDCRLGIITQLDKLVQGQSLIPCFQPIVELSDSTTIAYEAVVRSDVPDLWYPGEMFAAASRLNLTGPLSTKCREVAIAHAHRLPSPPTIFLNMHPSEPLSTVVQQLRGASDGLQGVAIVVEVHEKAVTEPSTMQKFKAELAELGVGLAYDDFGAGQSRLMDLVRVPPEYLKFDIDLVRDIEKTSTAHRSMVKALVGMVHDLGIKPLAEGVETQETADACRDLGFTFAQGYHFGRPLLADCWSHDTVKLPESGSIPSAGPPSMANDLLL